MTLVRRRGVKMPPKFPRGELLCENHDGTTCYSYDPLKVLAWLSAMGLVKVTATQAPNAQVVRPAACGRSEPKPGSAARGRTKT